MLVYLTTVFPSCVMFTCLCTMLGYLYNSLHLLCDVYLFRYNVSLPDNSVHLLCDISLFRYNVSLPDNSVHLLCDIYLFRYNVSLPDNSVHLLCDIYLFRYNVSLPDNSVHLLCDIYLFRYNVSLPDNSVHLLCDIYLFRYNVSFLLALAVKEPHVSRSSPCLPHYQSFPHVLPITKFHPLAGLRSLEAVCLALWGEPHRVPK
jgi:hypothetical protein